MSIITRTITNNLSTNLELFVPGYNTLKPQVVIAPSAEVDLFTVLTGDELEAIQNQLVPLVTNGTITVNATADTTTFNPIGGAADLTLTHNHIFVGNSSNIATDTALGVDTEIIFNSSGALTGNLNLAWDHTNTRLILGAPASPSTTPFKLEIYDNTNISSTSIAGKSLDASTSTDGIGIALLHNGSNNRQIGFFDTLVGLGSNNNIIRFALTPTPTIDVVDNTLASHVLGLGGSAGASFAGSVGIGTAPTTSAKLAIVSTTLGFLPPSMTTTQKNAISSPATGLVVYDNTLNKLSVFTGSVWETVTSS